MSQKLLKIYDGRGGFWQWDKGQRLIILDDSITTVHLSHKGEKSSRELDIKIENSMRICDIPDVFLQVPKNLVVYAVEQDYNEACTITAIEFAVKTRPQPDGYISVHDNEYDDVNARISSLEDAIGLGRPIDAELSLVSIRPVQNKVITQKINSIDEAISLIADWQNEVNEEVSNTVRVAPQAFTEAQKAQARANIGAADFIPVDDSLSKTSKNPVQNKVVSTAIDLLTGSIGAVRSVANEAHNVATTAAGVANEAKSEAAYAQNTIANIGIGLSTNNQRVTALETSVGVIDNTLDTMNNTMNEIRGDVATAHSAANSAMGRTQEIEVRVETLEEAAESVVLYTEQTLTDEQKAQVRENIGAGESITVDASLSSESKNPVQNNVVTKKLNEYQEWHSGMAHVVNNHSNDLGGIRDTLNTNVAQTTSLSKDINGIRDTLNTNVAQITSLSNDVTSNTQRIGSLEQKQLPSVTTNDNGKLLQVVDGKPTWVTITNGNEVAY